MPEPVQWLPDGTPHNARFDDIYRSASGGLAQAKHAFLKGCGLPQAWAGQGHWRILETGFGLGLNFLAAWQAWRDDPQRPGLLHFVSIEAWPVGSDDLLRSAAPWPGLQPLAGALAAQWWGLSPGLHRLAFEDGRVLLTLCIGDAAAALKQLDFAADAVFLDGFDPQRNPAMWSEAVLKGVARLCRRGARIASWTCAGAVRQQLTQLGFQVRKAAGLAPKRHSLQAVFDPPWTPRGLRPVPTQQAGRCLVVGAGLAGAAAAAALARRGWSVAVLDAAPAAAAGASALPAGLMAPHRTSDDNLLARLSRAGVRCTLMQLGGLLPQGRNWCLSGVLEQRADGQESLWHAHAAWVKPAALVQAWLARPGVQFLPDRRVARLQRRPSGTWQALGSDGSMLAEADLVVVAAAMGSGPLLPRALPLQPVRGQVSWGWRHDGLDLPASPRNGNGHFLPAVPLQDERLAWLCGSSYGRGQTSLEARPEDHAANLDRLQALAPEAARQLEADFASGQVQAWTGIRCASADRRPLVGCLEPGLWVSTAMGSRGLSFAALCAEILAARLHGEPLPVGRRLADALDVARTRPAAPTC